MMDPENTIESMRGLPSWVDGVEIDVRLSRDGVPIVMHDQKVDRTTNGRGRVDSMTAANIRRLEAGNGPVPTLAAYLAACEGRGWRRILVDMKDDDEAALTVTASTVEQSPVEDVCVVMVRPGDTAPRLRRINRTLPIGSFGGTVDNADAVLADMRSHGGGLVLTNPNAYIANRAVVTAAQAVGIAAGSSTNNAHPGLLAARADGADMVLTDVAEVLEWF